MAVRIYKLMSPSMAQETCISITFSYLFFLEDRPICHDCLDRVLLMYEKPKNYLHAPFEFSSTPCAVEHPALSYLSTIVLNSAHHLPNRMPKLERIEE